LSQRLTVDISWSQLPERLWNPHENLNSTALFCSDLVNLFLVDELNAERQLNELLAESLDEARDRAANRLALQKGDALILYGAGTLGSIVLERLRQVGVEPAAFADDTPEKQGQVVAG